MKWAHDQMYSREGDEEETPGKGLEGLWAPESRLGEGCLGRCGWMRCCGALGEEEVSGSLCDLSSIFVSLGPARNISLGASPSIAV